MTITIVKGPDDTPHQEAWSAIIKILNHLYPEWYLAYGSVPPMVAAVKTISDMEKSRQLAMKEVLDLRESMKVSQALLDGLGAALDANLKAAGGSQTKDLNTSVINKDSYHKAVLDSTLTKHSQHVQALKYEFDNHLGEVFEEVKVAEASAHNLKSMLALKDLVMSQMVVDMKNLTAQLNAAINNPGEAKDGTPPSSPFTQFFGDLFDLAMVQDPQWLNKNLDLAVTIRLKQYFVAQQLKMESLKSVLQLIATDAPTIKKARALAQDAMKD